MKINNKLSASGMLSQIKSFWELSGQKINSIQTDYGAGKGTPVFTIKGKYATQGWTEWTQGFQFGSELLQFDAIDDQAFLESGRKNTQKYMAPHVTHMGVHDHGFNNVSTYGTLWRLMNEGRIPENSDERNFYEMALKCSGAVQARRWTKINDGGGYIYSFNGPHSLFSDTIRSLRALAVAHLLGHSLMDEQDVSISLLERLVQHAEATYKYNVYFGQGRDTYDKSGRVVHESIFNLNDGCYRCPSSQQGYSPFTTWTRGLAWVMVGYAEQLEFMETLSDEALDTVGGRTKITDILLKTAIATCDFYIENTPLDGVPYWDTGAPGLAKMGDYLNRDSEPYNDYEPIDSSSAAIGSQGLCRLGRYFEGKDDAKAQRFMQAGLTALNTLLQEPYLSTDENHQGLVLHSVYHQPKGWDYIPKGQKVPCGESSMWGDYHMREAVLTVQRLGEGKNYYHFFNQK